MLYRLVRPMRRSDSSIPQFLQRIPSKARDRAIGWTLVIPLADGENATVRITQSTVAVRFSLRTRDPAEAKIRQARAAGYLQTVWRALQQQPVFLRNSDAHA